MRMHLAAAFVLAMSAPALGNGCSAFSVDQFLAPVAYFTESMAPVRLDDSGSLTFVHRDDPGIGATFSLVEVASDEDMTRSEYLRSVEAVLQSRSAEISKAGAVPQAAVHPHDPISTSIRMTSSDGAIVGETDMRLSPTCHLNVDWNASESPLLLSRSLAFIAAVDAVRALSTPLVEGGTFADEDTVPEGVAPLATGFLAPLIAALLLCLPRFAVPRTHSGTSPLPVRLPLGFGGIAAVLGIVACWSAYAAGLERLRYVDSLALLAVVAGVCAFAMITGRHLAIHLAISLLIAAGASLAVSCYFGWVPVTAVGIGVAAAITLSGSAALWVWQIAPSFGASGKRRPVT